MLSVPEKCTLRVGKRHYETAEKWKNTAFIPKQTAAVVIDDSSQSSGDLTLTSKLSRVSFEQKVLQQGSVKVLHFKEDLFLMAFSNAAPCLKYLPLPCKFISSVVQRSHRAHGELRRSVDLNQGGWKCC